MYEPGLEPRTTFALPGASYPQDVPVSSLCGTRSIEFDGGRAPGLDSACMVLRVSLGASGCHGSSLGDCDGRVLPAKCASDILLDVSCRHPLPYSVGYTDLWGSAPQLFPQRTPTGRL